MAGACGRGLAGCTGWRVVSCRTCYREVVGEDPSEKTSLAAWGENCPPRGETQPKETKTPFAASTTTPQAPIELLKGKWDTFPDAVSLMLVGLHAPGAGEGERSLPQAAPVACPAADPRVGGDPLGPAGGERFPAQAVPGCPFLSRCSWHSSG